MAYTTKTKVDALFGITMTQSVFDDLLAAVKIFIDLYTGKTFEGGSETRYYDSSGSDILNVDTFYGTAVVKILDNEGNVETTLTEGAGNDYVTSPYNSLEKSQIILTPNGRWSSFPSRFRGVSVTANFGAAGSVPADIQLVATRLIGEMWNASVVSATGDIKQESLGDYSITYSNSAETQAGLKATADRLGIYSILDLHRDIDI